MSFVKKFDELIPLAELQKYKTEQLKDMPLLRMGRLSVSKVDKACWDFILDLEKKLLVKPEE